MEAIKEWEKAIEQNYEETVNFMVKILVELLFYMVQLPPHVVIQGFMLVIYSYLQSLNLDDDHIKEILEVSLTYAEKRMDKIRGDLAQHGITI